jgi:putative hemolysin
MPYNTRQVAGRGSLNGELPMLFHPREELVCRVRVTCEGDLGDRLLALDGQPFERVLRFYRRGGFVLDEGGDDASAEPEMTGPDVLTVSHSASGDDIGRIPKEGPAVVVANHPFGGIEGLVLAAMARTVRADVRVVADGVLEGLTDAVGFLVDDPLDRGWTAMRSAVSCIDWVEDGGLLVVFPARPRRRFRSRRRHARNPGWRSAVARIVRRAEAPVLPVFFAGAHQAVFDILDLIRFRMRGAVRPHELLNVHEKPVRVRVGSLIPWDKLAQFPRDREMTQYLRMRTFILDTAEPRQKRRRRRRPSPPPAREMEPVAPPQDPDAITAEVEALPADRTIFESSGMRAIFAEACEIPLLLHEIGRLRELTFRAADEGTGNRIDLDRFDRHYTHLFAWDLKERRLVGAYRLGLTDRILSTKGENGLYTATLFNFRRGLFKKLNPAIELGRSFVRQEYQRSYAPLLTLWKGVARFVHRHPDHKRLFGPVSINEAYHDASRQLMIRFLIENTQLKDLARLIRPKTPMHRRRVRGWNPKKQGAVPSDVEELGKLISDIEADHKGVPILLRQYLRLGGRLLGCNIDPDFSNVLDALILVDLTETDGRILDRYMGKENRLEFFAYHGVPADKTGGV